MSNEQINVYEGMYILSAKLSDEARKKTFEKITNGMTSRGGELRRIHEQGRKKLAYEIKGHREGYYYLVYFTLLPNQVKELWDEYKINEDLVRYVTMRIEEDEILEKLEFKALAE